MFLHDINYESFDVAHGDTLIDPAHWDDEPFEAIVSNPPYSIKWEGEPIGSVPRCPDQKLANNRLKFHGSLGKNQHRAPSAGMGYFQQPRVINLLDGRVFEHLIGRPL